MAEIGGISSDGGAVDNLEYFGSFDSYSESPEWTVFRRPLAMSRNEDGKKHALLSVVASLSNLEHPIKLVRLSTLMSTNRFPRYNEDFDFEALSVDTVGQCVAISHRWSDHTNQRGSRGDAEWLLQNWENVKLPSNMSEDPLFFYDFTSLPQADDDRGIAVANDGETSSLSPSHALTFKAGLECVDLLYSQWAIAIPTTNYLFRYWCFLEYFIMTYKAVKVCEVDLLEPLPNELAIIDDVLKSLERAIMLPGRIGFKYRHTVSLVCKMVCLDSDDTGHILEAVFMIGTGQVDQEVLSSYYQSIVRMREKVVDLIKTRVRQCSLTVSTDRKWIDSVMDRYLRRPELPVICRLSAEAALELRFNAERILRLADDSDNEDN